MWVRQHNPFGNTNFKAIEYACSSKPGKEAHMQSWMNCNRTLFNPALIQAKPGKRGPLKIHEWPHPVRGHCLHDEIMYTYVMLTSYKREGENMFRQSIVGSLAKSLSLSSLCTIETSTNSCVFNQRKGEREGIRENRTINRTLRKYFWKSARNHHKNIGQSDRVADRYLVKKWKGGKTILFAPPL